MLTQGQVALYQGRTRAATARSHLDLEDKRDLGSTKPMTEAWIIDACRTPRGIGKVGKGALADFHPQHLAATVLKAIAERNNLNTAEVDDIIWGTSSQRGKQGGDMGRMAALDAGYDTKASGMTLDRFC